MEIVIKIPDKLYETIISDEYGVHQGCIYDIIRHGIPLPKGHGRLIDADKTISKICGSSCGCHLEECGHDEPCFSVTRIKSTPTIIEADKGESEVEG